jgi:hypothetical protein
VDVRFFDAGARSPCLKVAPVRRSLAALMSEAKDFLEHMEHAGHSGHGDHGGEGHGEAHKGPGKQIGITMAILGVMLALCAALVGSHRTELIKTTVEQSNKWGLYQAEAMKLRIIEGDLEMLHAISPNMEEEKIMDANLRAKSANAGKEDDADTKEIKDLIATSLDDLAELLTPDPEDEKHFGELAKKYDRDMREAKHDAEVFEPAIEAHQEAAEWYERAQLLAEIGIVIASIALLLSSRAVWTIAVVCGVGGAGVIGFTFVKTRGVLKDAEVKIEEAKKESERIEEDDEDEEEEKKLEEAAAKAGKSGGEKKEEGAKGEEKKPEGSAKPEEKKPEGGAKPEEKAPEKK